MAIPNTRSKTTLDTPNDRFTSAFLSGTVKAGVQRRAYFVSA